MAIAAASVWELRATATAGNTNGGFFVTGASGVDYSQQDAAQYALTGGATAGADAVFLHANAAADMVGNGMYIVSGTNFTVGWYQILSVVVGVSITLDRNCASGVGANGVANIGGAMSLGSTLDDEMFESMVAGNTVWVKNGSLATGEAISITADGSATNPIKIIGYNAARGDYPTGATRPTIALDGFTFALGDNWEIYNIIFTTTHANGVAIALANKIVSCKVTNSSGSANRAAVTVQAANTFIIRCELMSTLGRGIVVNGSATNVECLGNYIHDCETGVLDSSTTLSCTYYSNIIESCTTTALNFTAAKTGITSIIENTFFGANTPAGTGVNISTGGTNIIFINNIVQGFVTGVVHADVQTIVFLNFNNYFNNTTARTNVATGPNDVALDSGFTDAPGGNFVTGSNVQRVGFPGTSFPGALTNTFRDIGAAQTSGALWWALPAVGDIKSGVTARDNSLVANVTGTGANIASGLQISELG